MTELRIDRSNLPPGGIPRDFDRHAGPELRVSIIGASVADGQISAAAFGSLLVPLGRLVERVSEIATGVRLSPRISDRFERGSFVFTITPPHNLGDALQWLTTTTVMLELLGIPTGKDGGLRALIHRWRQAKLPDKAAVFDEPILTSDAVEIAAKDYDVIRHAADFAKVLNTPGIDTLQIYTEDSVRAVIDKSDARALKALRQLAPSTHAEVAALRPSATTPPAEYITEGLFEIVSAGLTPSAPWVLRSGDDGSFEAHMHDSDFSEQVVARSITFGTGDKIRAVLRSIHWAGKRRPGISRRITRVIAFIPASPTAHSG